MCRWLAYLGTPLSIDTLLYRAEDPFAYQSLHARRTLHATNGDGCGIGWYANHTVPGIFHSIRPAWNSENLKNLSQQIDSHLFFAHVRATSGTAIQQSNCHPFRYQNCLFQHNGQIREFSRIKRAIDGEISAELYPLMEGSTDTQRMFFLALTFGLLDDPPAALGRMVAKIEHLAEIAGIANPLTMTVAVANGSRVCAVRYSSSGRSPSLFHSKNIHALREVGGESERLDERSTIILSEPLDEVSRHWEEIPESTVVIASEEGIDQFRFKPDA